jgi:hypothetical protein
VGRTHAVVGNLAEAAGYDLEHGCATEWGRRFIEDLAPQGGGLLVDALFATCHDSANTELRRAFQM